ncbi:DUF551 domain-containing protein [Pseudomonas viridiflava]|uniref:DUF551 domain-containing protein n=1 Tax=Pseudomonas viridiflava TaxID=33069 RepID=UPI000F010CC2|nr:DUF551 domain-containing protein [Pseudomonas viridiflava]
MSEWIKCSDRLPEHGVNVLVIAMGATKKKNYTTATLCSIQRDFREEDSPYDDQWYQTVAISRELLGITHWMPLPKPPTA